MFLRMFLLDHFLDQVVIGMIVGITFACLGAYLNLLEVASNYGSSIKLIEEDHSINISGQDLSNQSLIKCKFYYKIYLLLTFSLGLIWVVTDQMVKRFLVSHLTF